MLAVIEKEYSKFLELVLAVFGTAKNVISFMDRKMADTEKWADGGRSNTLTFNGLFCLSPRSYHTR